MEHIKKCSKSPTRDIMEISIIMGLKFNSQLLIPSPSYKTLVLVPKVCGNSQSKKPMVSNFGGVCVMYEPGDFGSYGIYHSKHPWHPLTGLTQQQQQRAQATSAWPPPLGHGPKGVAVVLTEMCWGWDKMQGHKMVLESLPTWLSQPLFTIINHGFTINGMSQPWFKNLMVNHGLIFTMIYHDLPTITHKKIPGNIWWYSHYPMIYKVVPPDIVS